ncbi:MAG: bifunctional hydroxymethylpyrimidine kinase/phosphomethylpyrimidine kinase, partial [Anaerococcus obesiensis]
SNFLTNTLEVYKKQNRKYKAVFVGFVLNFNQAKIICDFVKENNLFMVLDPIMGDSGKIYSGLDKNIVEIYKYMADYAHIIIPNLTEARLLTDNKFKKAHDIVDYYENIGKKFIITSVEDGNRHFILAKDKYFIEEDYKFLDKSFGGSGDLFDSIFLANYLKNNDFLLAIKNTRDMIACILDMQIKIDDKANDISINEILKKL